MKALLKKIVLTSMITAQSMSCSWASDELEERGAHAFISWPTDVLKYTFSLVGPKELSRMACVSKEWQTFCDNDALWRGRVVGA
ncbi:MAG: F-box protein [Alphaproteobacteria bacterium]|nr:F-box protein [Alphaproteobacteria bacterium]